MTVDQRSRGVDRGTIEALDKLVGSDALVGREEVVSGVDRRLDADAPAVYVVGNVLDLVVVVVDMNLAETDARRSLTDILEQVMMQRHAQLAAIGDRPIR